MPGEKKLDGNYTRTLHAVLNESWEQQPISQVKHTGHYQG